MGGLVYTQPNPVVVWGPKNDPIDRLPAPVSPLTMAPNDSQPRLSHPRQSYTPIHYQCDQHCIPDGIIAMMQLLACSGKATTLTQTYEVVLMHMLCRGRWRHAKHSDCWADEISRYRYNPPLLSLSTGRVKYQVSANKASHRCQGVARHHIALSHFHLASCQQCNPPYSPRAREQGWDACKA